MDTLQAEFAGRLTPRNQGTRHQDGLAPGFEPAQAEFRAGAKISSQPMKAKIALR